MTDISFSVPAKLLATSNPVTAPGARPLDHGSLGRMVGKVMNAEPQDRWRYAIALDNDAYLHVQDIEELAGTRLFADWQAGQA